MHSWMVMLAVLAVGGSGRETCFRQKLWGSRVSKYVADMASMPLVRVGRAGVCSSLVHHSNSLAAAAAA